MAETAQLKSRHLTMMGLGSAVGAGLFLGVGLGIQISGTSVLISYAVAGALIALVMWMLGEMAAARPSLGHFPPMPVRPTGTGHALPWDGFIGSC